MSRVSKIIEDRRKESGVFFKESKLFVPVNMQIPETANQVLARTLLRSGVIDEETANKMLGVSIYYDSDSEKEFDDDDDDFFFDEMNDEFILSKFAEYEEDLEVLNGKEDQEQTAESVSGGGADSENDVSSEAVGEQGVSGITAAE